MTARGSIGFISANFVARDSGYDGTDDWGTHDKRTRETFDLEQTVAWIEEVATMGFDGLSLWTAHCWYHTVSDDDIVSLRQAAEDAGLPIFAYAGSFGVPPDGADTADDEVREEAWHDTVATASLLGAQHLAGGYAPSDEPFLVEACKQYDVAFAFENHPESSASEIRARIPDTPHAGVAFDTGWAVTQELNASRLIRELGDDLIEIHLKDVESPGSHDTCALGAGALDLEGCLDTLDDIGFDGWISIEHEPYDRDPLPEISESLEKLEELGWV